MTKNFIKSFIAIAIFGLLTGGMATQAKTILIEGDIIGSDMLGSPNNSQRFERSLIPELDSTYYLGTTTKAWLQATSDSFCLTGDTCITTWNAGSMTTLPEDYVYVGDSSNTAVATSSLTISSNGLVTLTNKLKFSSFSATPLIYASSDTNTGLLLPEADTLALMAGGTNRLYINSTGYVGIGTTTPAYLLDVYGNSRIDGTLTIGAYTLPSTDGALAGYTLKTDAMGNIYWSEDETTGGEITLYFHDEESEIAGYESLFTYPTNSPEVEDTATSAESVISLIDAYISTTTDLTISNNIPAGTWHFHTFASVDNAVNVTKIQHNIYKRATTGVETLLFTATSTEINALSAQEYQYNTTQPEFTFDSTDRLVIKNYCYKEGPVVITCSFYYEGNTNYSHVVTPLSNADLGYARFAVDGTILADWDNTANPWTDDEVADDITASNYLSLVDWFATTTHALISSLPSLSEVGTIASGVWNGTAIDFSDYTNATASNGLQINGDNIEPASGYSIPLTASTTNWSIDDPTFTASSSSLLLTGTTTIPLGVSIYSGGEEWDTAYCWTTGGTADVRCGNGTTYSDTWSVGAATSSVNINYNFNFLNTRECQVGNVSSIGWLTCTFKQIY